MGSHLRHESNSQNINCLSESAGSFDSDFQTHTKVSADEKFSLADQVKRSSRSVCANIAEAYRKRRYIKDYTNKLSISDGELSETQVWLDISLGCEYMTISEYETLMALSEECGKLIGHMLNNPLKYGVLAK